LGPKRSRTFSGLAEGIGRRAEDGGGRVRGGPLGDRETSARAPSKRGGTAERGDDSRFKTLLLVCGGAVAGLGKWRRTERFG